MNKTNIEYLTHTWNPIAMRCDPVSEGCKNCWHLTLSNRLSKNPMISEDRQKAYAGGEPVLIKKELDAPSKLRKPAIIGVQFMGDLFHADIGYEIQASIFVEMMLNPQHTYLVLTKRPENMLSFLENFIYMGGYWFDVPVKYHPQIWLGCTCENQQTADERIPILLQIPAAVRFVSIEPMLSQVDLSDFVWEHDNRDGLSERDALDWVIAGGESGPKARPMHPDWARSIRDQCRSAGVPFFFKQWGEWAEMKQTGAFIATGRAKNGTHTGRYDLKYYDKTQAKNITVDYVFNDISVYRVGKKKAGRILDGRIWDEIPNTGG